MLNEWYEKMNKSINSIEELQKRRKEAFFTSIGFLLFAFFSAILSTVDLFYLGFAVLFGVYTILNYISLRYLDLKLFLLKQKEKGFEKC